MLGVEWSDCIVLGGEWVYCAWCGVGVLCLEWSGCIVLGVEWVYCAWSRVE